LAFVFARAVHARWQAVRQVSSGPVPLKDVLVGVRFKDLVREARAAI